MGDRGHNRHGPKRGGAAVPFSRELGPRLVQCGLGRGLLPYQAASSSIQPFGHNRHGPKLGRGALFAGGSWVHIEHNVAQADAYLRTKWHLDPCSRLATIEIGRKLGRGLHPFVERGLGPHLTQSRLG